MFMNNKEDLWVFRRMGFPAKNDFSGEADLVKKAEDELGMYFGYKVRSAACISSIMNYCWCESDKAVKLKAQTANKPERIQLTTGGTIIHFAREEMYLSWGDKSFIAIHDEAVIQSGITGQGGNAGRSGFSKDESGRNTNDEG
ncbi:hypothetical protein Tco_0121777 [Tanacetum coccineum]